MATHPSPLSSLRAYGKLPISREFLRIQCSTGHALSFRSFLDEAAPYCSGPDLPDQRVARLCMAFPGGRAAAVASIWASADEGQQRPYPFSVFSILELENWERMVPGFWSALEPSFADQDSAYESATAFPDGKSFDLHFASIADGAKPSSAQMAQSSYELEAKSVALGPWAKALYPGDPEAFLTSLWRLHKVLGGDSSFATGLQEGLRLPLSADHSLAAQIDAWLSLAVKGEKEAPGSHLSLLLVETTPRPSLSIVPGPLKAHHLAAVRGREVSGQVDLTVYREPADLDGYGAFRDRIAATLADPRQSLASLEEILQNR